MWFYICQAIILIVATVLLFRDHNNMNKNLAGFVEGTLTIKNLVLGIIALFFAIISLVFIYVAPVLVDESLLAYLKGKVPSVSDEDLRSIISYHFDDAPEAITEEQRKEINIL